MSLPTILCVDDEEVILTSLERFLTKRFVAYLEIEMAQSGEDALEIVKELKDEKKELAIVVCDYIMPNLKGDEVLKSIHKLYPDSKKIMLTGQASIEGIENAINGADLYRFIQKPWDSDDLYLTIQEALLSFTQAKQIESHTKILEETVKKRTSDLEKAIENLEQTQDKLIQTEKMAALGKLVAGVAHEINTPIGVCVTASSTLKKRAEGLIKKDITQNEATQKLEDIAQISDLVLKNVQKANELIKSFKRVATDQSSEGYQEIDICNYLNEIAKTLHPQYARYNHSLEIECEKLIIKTLPGPFGQIISNLVMNSLIHGFNEDGGKIVIKVLEKDDRIVIKYSDNGCGIDKSIQNRIFEPFFTTNRGEGSGLGLHIVYNIVTAKLGGSIKLESKEQKGTSFEITLPSEYTKEKL
ncbi:MAG: ATP-binding protein [Campylobacterales bacterium]